MIQEIFVIEDKEELINDLKCEFKKTSNIDLKHMKPCNLSEHLLDIPALILIHEDLLIDASVNEICKLIRNNEDNSSTPIVVLTSDTSPEHERSILEENVQICIKKPVDNKSLYYTIRNLVDLILINRGISPLTKLPGNIPIQAELKKRLLKKQNFAVLYFDLDNFKAYNDTYGFLGGDEVIKQTARIIVKNVNSNENIHNFVGHIGGDDFVALVSNENYDDILQNIILEFDKKIIDYF